MCELNNNPNIITEESAEIIRISGTHKSVETNNHVLGFSAQSKTIQFCPKGLEKIFKNIKVINIYNCQLKEILQSDLKVFLNLVYFYLFNNEIEVIEEGLFDFNPNLELIWLYESKIIHIDPNVFDHLTKLRYLYLSFVPCINQDVDDSKEKVQEVLKVIKSNCSNSEFLSLENQIKNLEIESKTLNSEDFDTKFEIFEKSFKNSKFLKFRPLNYKFQNLKSSISTIHNNQVQDIILSNGLKNITDKIENLRASQCRLNHPVDELKASQNEVKITLNSIKSSVTNQESKLDQIQKSLVQIQDSMSSSISNVISKVSEVTSSISQIEVKVSDLKSSQFSSFNSLESKFDNSQKDHGAVLSVIQDSQKKADASINELKTSQNETILAIWDLKLSQDSSLSNITSKFNDLKNDIKSTQDDTRLSINDIEVKLSDNKKFQAEVKDSFTKVRSMQNEMKMALNDLSVNKNDGFVGKFSNLSDKIESLEGHFKENSGKLVQIEKELTYKFHKMSTNFDEKVKGIEKRLVKKIEEILEEKLGKMIDRMQNL